MAEQRQKEIGIRKVLGASSLGLVRLMSQDFLWLVLLANILAVPAAYWWGRQWLQDFAYRIEINALIFVLAAVAALMISLFTISSQAWRATRVNPAEVLKEE